MASGAMGSHPLDLAWGTTDTWVGIGFGLERPVTMTGGSDFIRKGEKPFLYKRCPVEAVAGAVDVFRYVLKKSESIPVSRFSR